MALETQLSDVLSGVRVLDFTWVVGGPLATRMLAALGAEVIKIETETRAEYLNRGAQFRLLNEGKLSCALDLKTESGRDNALDLAATCDVVVENFSPGTLARLGLGFPELYERRPDVVLVSLSGLGQSGPYRDYVSYGSLLQSFSGWTRLICPEDELADDRLGMVPVWADYLAGCMVAIAAMAGLAETRRTGRGLHLDVSVLESVLALMPGPASQASPDRPVVGNHSSHMAVHDVYRCAGGDEWVAVVAAEDSEIRGLETLLGLPLDTPPPMLRAVLGDWCRGTAASVCVGALRTAGVPAALSESLWSLLENRTLWDEGLFRTIGDEPSVAVPWRALGGSDRGRVQPAPTLGQHTAAVIDLIGTTP